MICVEEFLSLNPSCSPGRQSTQELVDNSVMAKTVVGHGVGVHQRCSAVAEQLTVTIRSVVIQCLKESCGAVDVTSPQSKCLRNLRVDGEERWPFLCVLRPIPEYKLQNTSHKNVTPSIEIDGKQQSYAYVHMKLARSLTCWRIHDHRSQGSSLSSQERERWCHE